MTKPCKTLNHVINMSSGNDVIQLDAFNTATVSYNKCPTTTTSVTGKIIFHSWNGIATINCSGNALSFKDNSSRSTTVEFYHLKFLDTFLKIKDVSLIVKNCSLGSFQNGSEFPNLIDVLVTNTTTEGNLRINITSTIFLEKNNAGSLSVNNNQSFPVFVEMSNITIFKNYLEKTKYVISMKGYVNFNFMNSEISNTKFLGKIPVALATFSNCLIAETKKDRAGGTLRKRKESHGFKERGLPSFDPQSFLITFSLRDINFFSNDAIIVSTSFCTEANVRISNTTLFNNTIPEASSERAFVFITSMVKKLKVILNNSSFVQNKVGLDNSGCMMGVKAISKNVTLFVTQCKFFQNIGGGVFYSSYSSPITLYTTFVASYCADHICNKNTSESTKKGQGFYPRTGQSPSQYEETLNSDLVFEDCEFHNNRGFYPSIIIKGEPFIYLRIQMCVFVGNIGTNSGAIHVIGTFGCTIADSKFYNNSGIFGAGAISVLWVKMLIKNCTLDSNNGGDTEDTQPTGSVSLSGGGSFSIQDSRIFQRDTTQSISYYGTFHGVHSTLGLSSDMFSNVTVSNSTLDYSWSPSLEKVIIIQLAHTKNFVLKEGTSIKCPSGYKIKDSKKLGIKPENKPTLQNFECQLCALGSYTIDRGVYR